MYHLPLLQELGFTIIRMSFGIIFAILGYIKLLSGSEKLTELGSAIGLLGIKWGYLFWGYIAALTLFLGGISFALGLYIRVASISLVGFLIVALYFHFQRNDPFTNWAFACMSLCLVVAFLIAGSGTYSLDHIIKKCSPCKNEDPGHIAHQ